MAESFAEQGLDIVLADIDEGQLSRAAARITDGGGSALAVRTDVRYAEQVNDLAVATLDHFGHVDVVANNAGVVALGFTWEIEDSDWDWVLGVNLRGVINGLRAFVPHLISQNSGHVVNTASMAGISVMPGIAPYLASKHAVVALSEGLSAELTQVAPGVGVTVVCPGMVDTNILNSGRSDSGERPTSILAESAASADGQCQRGRCYLTARGRRRDPGRDRVEQAACRPERVLGRGQVLGRPHPRGPGRAESLGVVAERRGRALVAVGPSRPTALLNS